MGEIAEMHIDGTVCECCGEFLDGETPGYPRYCSASCANDRGVEFDEDDDDEESTPTVESIEDSIDGAICWIQIAIEQIKELKLKGKIKELRGIIKCLEQYNEKLKEK